MKNFYPQKYSQDKRLFIKHNYLSEQFKNNDQIFKEIKKIVLENDFTLGKKVDEFEKKISKLLNSKYTIALGSGTDALMLSLKALNIGMGDEVITTPFTFYATIGAIVSSGARPVFADVNDDYNIDPKQILKKINSKTKAILPVHWSGKICDMKKIRSIAKKKSLYIVEDACHAILAKQNKKFAGNFGDFGCFSLHPLKNLNVWGDGGFAITSSKKNYQKLMLLRNHGLLNRNITKVFSYNSRLDTIQAVVALNLLKKIKFITKKRILNSNYLDANLNQKYLKIKKRNVNDTEVYHLYEVRVSNKNIRNKLVDYLIKNKIDAKIHYPVPMHLQPAAKIYGYKKGDFPVAEKLCNTTLSLPVHEFITKESLDYMVEKINNFFK
jgi:aminotransferase EvaB